MLYEGFLSIYYNSINLDNTFSILLSNTFLFSNF